MPTCSPRTTRPPWSCSRPTGVAIENARLYKEAQQAQHELRRLEVLEERERIAKELHDGVIQALFAVGMGLQGLGARVEDPEIAGRLDDAVEDIDGAIRDLRNYILACGPASSPTVSCPRPSGSSVRSSRSAPAS